MREFISKGKKIIPELSDDWRIAFEDDKVCLVSDVLSQYIYDINLNKLLSFTINNEFKINGSEIEGILAVNKGKSFLNSEEYQNNHIEHIDNIPYDDLEVGKKYFDIKGEKFLYLGFRYISTIKPKQEDFKFTKIVKKHFASYYRKVIINGEERISSSRISVLTKDVERFSSSIVSEDTKIYINNSFDRYFEQKLDIVYFNIVDNKSPEYGLIEIEDNRRSMFLRTEYGIVGNSKDMLNSKKPFLKISGITRNHIEGSNQFKIKERRHSFYNKDLTSYGMNDYYFQEMNLDDCQGYRIGVIN